MALTADHMLVYAALVSQGFQRYMIVVETKMVGQICMLQARESSVLLVRVDVFLSKIDVVVVVRCKKLIVGMVT